MTRVLHTHEILKQYFGYHQFRGHQEQIIQTVLEKKDCLVLMPTGAGKSICYQVPALLQKGITLVVSPLISLMKNQVDVLRTNGIEAAFLNSSLTLEQENELIARCFTNQIKLLYMSPEKVQGLLTRFLKHLPISLIAIDEAHCVSQWGHDFRPEYKELYKLREILPDTPLMALTATADKITRADIVTILRLNAPEYFIASFDRPNLGLAVKSGFRKKEKMKDIISFIRQHPNDSGIIYCTSRATTEKVALELQQSGIQAKAYHAGMSNDERNSVQEAFLKDDTRIVCATIAFGMGIDKSNVRFVMHYNLPKSIENYYQEIGRGGRDGLPCKTVLYYSIGDLMLLRSFVNQSGQSEINQEKLARIQEFAEANHCRRKILLAYFGQPLSENCGNCDICIHPPASIDGTIIAQKVLSALSRINQLGEHIGSNLLIDVLRGMKHAGVFSRKLNTIKTYGAGADLSSNSWNAYILQMIQLGVLEIAYQKGNSLEMTPYGEQILRGKLKLYLTEPIGKNDSNEHEQRGLRNVAFGLNSENLRTHLFEQLRAIRKQIADEEGLPPYVVFHDSTLHDMIDKQPQTMDEMLVVSGVSSSKQQKYGEVFLKILNNSDAYVSTVNIGEVLSEAKLITYKEELEQKHLRFSAAVVGSVLAGDTSARYAVIGKQVSFYGLLQGVIPYEEIRKRINPFYAPLEKAYKEAKKQIAETKEAELELQLEKAAAYFSASRIQLLSDADWLKYQHQIEQLPFYKPTELASEAIQQLRQQHFRANEPWTDEEEAMLKQVLKKSNDLARIIELMGRSERSISVKAAQLLSSIED